MMELSEIAERISHKIAAKGKTADPKRIEMKLKRLVEEFGVAPTESERTVTRDLEKELGLSGISGGGPTEQKKLAEVIPGEWISFEGRVVSLTPSLSPSISQTGIIADPSGAIRFVVWEKAKAPVLKEGKWYRVESAVVDEFKGVPNLKIHSGTIIREVENDSGLIPNTIPVRDLKPGIASVRVKMIQEWEAPHDRMLQSGLLGDETGTVRFIIWKEAGKEKLAAGSVYNIYYAPVDEFNGRLSLNLAPATYLGDEGDIVVSTGEASVRGALVHIAPGSGLIKRCPVEGCNRALSRQNYCPVHEIQPNFHYDLRIKGWLDDGKRTWNVLIQRDVVESITALTLEKAREIAENNPLGMDEVFLRVRELVTGRYFLCKGRDIDGRLLVNSCERVAFDPAVHAALLNRAGGAQV
jgi:replication factor A1